MLGDKKKFRLPNKAKMYSKILCFWLLTHFHVNLIVIEPNYILRLTLYDSSTDIKFLR